LIQLKGLIIASLMLATMVVTNIRAGESTEPRIVLLNASTEYYPTQGSFDVLHIDGEWLNDQVPLDTDSRTMDYVKTIVLSGIPTAILGGDVHFYDMIRDPAMKYTVGYPTTAEAIRVYPEITLDGRLVYDQLFVTGINTTRDKMEQCIHEWTISKIPNKFARSNRVNSPDTEKRLMLGQRTRFGGGSGPYWDLQLAYTFLILADPYGDLNITHCWYILRNDGSNAYSWFNLVTEITSTPGIVEYGSDWRTAHIRNSIDLDYYGDPNLLVDHGPSDTSGVNTADYDLGVQAGEEGAMVSSEMAVSYSVQDVIIDNQSEPTRHNAWWQHDVPEDKTVGMNEYTVKPGVTLRFLPIAPFSVHTWHQASYGQPYLIIFWEYWHMPEIPIRIDWLGRDIDVIIVKADDSPSWWIDNADDVSAGVLEAVNDANSNGFVKFANEQINVYEVSTVEDLFGLALNPPLRATIINTHGEVIPMSSWYFGPSIHITSPAEGETISSNPTVYADVDPPPGDLLQLCSPDGYAESAYVWCRWYRPSTGESFWKPMFPNASSGGAYYRYMNLPGDDTYQIYVHAFANYLESMADITVYYEYVPPPPGGCPYISTHDGDSFVLDNNLLPAAAYSNGTDVVDYYKVQQPLISNADGTYSLLLSEFQTEHDFIDQVRLLTVDHSSGVNVAVDAVGEILTYKNPKPPRTAIDSEGNDVHDSIRSMDGEYYEGCNESYVVLDFGVDDNHKEAKLVLRADRPPVKTSIHVQAQDQNGSWTDVASFIPRHYWSTEIIDLSGYISDGDDELKVRLYFTAEHKLDFAGLDASKQACIEVQESQLISARCSTGLNLADLGHSRKNAMVDNILFSDDLHAELTPGRRIEMNFSVPEMEGSNRDFMFVIEGYFDKAGSPYACTTVWEEWFDLLEDRSRNFGWVWTNVAGYSCYHFGNTWYNSKIPEQYREIPARNGLKRFLTMEVNCTIYPPPAREAQLDVHFADRTGFSPSFYDDLPVTNIAASRPLATTGIPLNTIGYLDAETGERVTASITMNSTMSATSMMSGVFIHSGFDADASDWVKGYVAAMLAIEEARAFIMTPKTFTQTQGNVHSVVFSATMLPGGWGTGSGNFPDIGSCDFKYVDILLTISTHYEDHIYTTYYFDEGGMHIVTHTVTLDETDFEFSSLDIDSETWAQIELAESGWETGGTDTTLFDQIGSWSAGLTAATLGRLVGIPYLGSVVGLIPILISSPSSPDVQPQIARHVWANRTAVDPNDDEWGTISFYFRIILRKQIGTPMPRTYDLNLKMASWLGEWASIDMGVPSYTPRLLVVPYSTDVLQFEVMG